MKLSIIIPVRNEGNVISKTLDLITNSMNEIDYEVLAINDFSDDDTCKKVEEKINTNSKIKLYNNSKKGLGGTINLGIEKCEGEAVCIMMADMSDEIDDLKKYYQLIQKKDISAVFGSRFIKGSNVSEYPLKKLFLNRIFNYLTKFIFFSDYNDFTNAFKIYKKDALIKAMPLVSESFNIFLEMPLKIISRKMKYEIIPIAWKNRKVDKAKFNIKELRSKYLFTLIYCFLEKILLRK